MNAIEPNNKSKPKLHGKRRSEKAFKRSRAARERRAQADKSDFRLISLILQLSVLMALGLVGLGVLAQKKAAQSPALIPSQNNAGPLHYLAEPWIGDLSRLEAIGIILITILSAALLYHWRRQK